MSEAHIHDPEISWKDIGRTPQKVPIPHNPDDTGILPHDLSGMKKVRQVVPCDPDVLGISPFDVETDADFYP